MYLVLESPAGTDKTLVALQAAHRFVIFLCSLDESLLGQRTMLQVADNLFDSYIGACEKSDNAEPLLVVTVCQKNVASLTKFLQYCTWTREKKTWKIIRKQDGASELGLNKQPSTAVERFPK